MSSHLNQKHQVHQLPLSILSILCIISSPLLPQHQEPVTAAILFFTVFQKSLLAGSFYHSKWTSVLSSNPPHFSSSQEKNRTNPQDLSFFIFLLLSSGLSGSPQISNSLPVFKTKSTLVLIAIFHTTFNELLFP